MKALVKTLPGPGHVEVVEVEKPRLPAADWALIRIKACGVCGTDVHVWQDKFMSWPPVTLGHELSGVIEQVGSECKASKPGDRVVVEPGINACGLCDLCLSGNSHLCAQKLTLGWRINGAMTQFVAMPEVAIHKIPEGLDFTLAALAEPLAVAIYSIAERGRVNLGDYVVVLGSGPIGILSAYMAKRLGARRVILTGLHASEKLRFGVAARLGANAVINVQREDVGAIVLRETDGTGADCVIETSGANAAIAGLTGFIKKCGRVIGIGLPATDETPFRWKEATLKALEVHFSMSTSHSAWNKALALLRADGDVLKQLITWTGPIDDWEKVFHALVSEDQVKAIFEFA